MYANDLGRFTAVDPLLASGRNTDPQTFNRYVYVVNSPLVLRDPSGLDWFLSSGKYRWSSDNKRFDDNSDDVSGDRIDLGVSGMFLYSGCVDSVCSATEDAVLMQGGRFEWARDLNDDELIGANSANSRTYFLGEGWMARVDQFDEGGQSSFEIHVGRADNGGNLPKENQVGTVKGRDGWVGKHGGPTSRPDGIPDSVMNKVNGINVNEMRRRGTLPAQFRRGAYLREADSTTGRPAAQMFGGIRGLRLGINVVSAVQGVVNDYEVYRRAKQNNRSIWTQYHEDWKTQGPYIMTMIGPMPNPCYPSCNSGEIHE